MASKLHFSTAYLRSVTYLQSSKCAEAPHCNGAPEARTGTHASFVVSYDCSYQGKPTPLAPSVHREILTDHTLWQPLR